ncbi:MULTISPECIES: GIY-YIG nuclease family protein [Moorena]|uniref:Putative viral transcriptional regulator n=1 Tax=Moorena producens 3L TaxID=489825 RepID=F4XW35_9CYAN|nr:MULTISPECIES: GIY-YIG nuclease family protein [Moorena]NEQ13652.1 GIY-YIG nuclease family protein [Moorena sp. SIO3E2]EGJ31224.1 putative viral transcriptional regulator [Moorena producens 3L]NEP33312.1 GIY-YIG nuclease family protein [Moorena sp. SIO3B2]NEP68548.1 GIY-YIG nuclease family protein [Moorena sp. SIO3A5]NEQ08833.1 GIY-YIG nuclease family protein [Moorena sp. SIO4E2]
MSNFRQCSPYDLLALAVDEASEGRHAAALRYMTMAVERSKLPEYASDAQTFIRLHKATGTLVQSCLSSPEEENPARLYFILDKGRNAIRIGYTTNPNGNIRGLETKSVKTLELIKIIPGSAKMETEFHRKFQHLRISGEWFDATPEVMRYISSL